MRWSSSLAVAALASLPVEGAANPIAVEVVRARQVPRSTHVQVTYAVDRGFGPLTDPVAVKRDGQPLAATWVKNPSDFVTNTGSGLQKTLSTQLCDCAVAAGAHTYVVTITNRGGMGTTDLMAAVTVAPGYSGPPDAGVPRDGGFPWDIPDPPELQGLDCAKQCAQPRPDMATAPPDLAVAPAPDLAIAHAINPEKRSGCAVGREVAPGGLVALLLGVALLALRRRR